MNRHFLVLLALAGCSGIEPCETEVHDDGSRTITCPDGTQATVDAPVADCTMDVSSEGNSVVTCGDGSEVELDPHSGCTVTDADDGGLLVSCDDGTSVTVPAGSKVLHRTISPGESVAFDHGFDADRVTLTAQFTDGQTMYDLADYPLRYAPLTHEPVMIEVTTGNEMDWNGDLALLALANGELAVSWVEEPPDGIEVVHLARVAADGSVLHRGSMVSLDRCDGPMHLAELTGGEIAHGCGSGEAFLHLFDATAQPIGTPVVLTANANNESAAVAAAADGGVYVAYNEWGEGDLDHTVVAKYSNTGVFESEIWRKDFEDSADDDLVLSMLPNGQLILITKYELGTVPEDGTYLVWLETDGTLVREVRLSQGAEGGGYDMRVDPVTGRIVVGFDASGPDAMVLAAFEQDGTVVTAPHHPLSDEPRDIVLAMHDDGDVTMLWANDETDSGQYVSLSDRARAITATAPLGTTAGMDYMYDAAVIGDQIWFVGREYNESDFGFNLYRTSRGYVRLENSVDGSAQLTHHGAVDAAVTLVATGF